MEAPGMTDDEVRDLFSAYHDRELPADQHERVAGPLQIWGDCVVGVRVVRDRGDHQRRRTGKTLAHPRHAGARRPTR